MEIYMQTVEDVSLWRMESIKTAFATGTAQYVYIGNCPDSVLQEDAPYTPHVCVCRASADDMQTINEASKDIPERGSMAVCKMRGEDIREELQKQGFDETKKAFFDLRCIGQMRNENEVKCLFDALYSFAADGSTAVFCYRDANAELCADENIFFCSDEMRVTSLLEHSHFFVYEHLFSDDKYRTCCVLAVLKGAQFVNTKEKILRNSLRLFAKNGYGAVSVKDIADSLFLSKGALYKHYSCKRDIFDSIVARMEDNDAKRARFFEVPDMPAEQAPDKYIKTDVKKLTEYALAQFRYWTEDVFASDFRKMLTVERYGNSEMSDLYNMYICSGPLEYTEDVFFGITGDRKRSKKLALLFYSPVFLMYSVYDGTENKNEAYKTLCDYLGGFEINE